MTTNARASHARRTYGWDTLSRTRLAGAIAWQYVQEFKYRSLILAATVAVSVALLIIVATSMRVLRETVDAASAGRRVPFTGLVVYLAPDAIVHGDRSFLDAVDLERLRSAFPGSAVALERKGSGMVGTSVSRTRQISLIGVDGDWFDVRKPELTEGRIFSPYEARWGSKRAALIGLHTADSVFAGQPTIGRTLLVNGILYTVVGVLRSEFSAQIGSDPDDYVVVPANSTGAVALMKTSGQILITLRNYAGTHDAAMVRDELRVRHALGPMQADNFRVYSPGSERPSLWASVNQSLLIGTSVLIAIAACGSAMILTAAMSVAVRTRRAEIGIRRAVGARRIDIGLQFTLEAFIISLAGSVSGFGVATGLLWGALRMETIPSGVTGAVTLGMAIGLMSGIGPALRASRLRPAEAFRT
jgi:putative ABC transport system permease protein